MFFLSQNDSCSHINTPRAWGALVLSVHALSLWNPPRTHMWLIIVCVCVCWFMSPCLNSWYCIAVCVNYYTITHQTSCFFFNLCSYFGVFPGNTQLLCSAEMLREVRRHSCSGDLESVLALANISAAFCTVCAFTYCWCIWLRVEIILPGNQQILQHMKRSVI